MLISHFKKRTKEEEKRSKSIRKGVAATGAVGTGIQIKKTYDHMKANKIKPGVKSIVGNYMKASSLKRDIALAGLGAGLGYGAYKLRKARSDKGKQRK